MSEQLTEEQRAATPCLVALCPDDCARKKKKQKPPTPPPHPPSARRRQTVVDILFLAHKRPEFTRASLNALLANTSHEEHFYVCTDDGCDGMGFPELRGLPNCTVDRFHYGGPVACTNGFLNSLKQMRAADKVPPEATPEFIAKIDNDVIVPPGWLPACLDIMRRFPNIDLLGIEPWTPDTKAVSLEYTSDAGASELLEVPAAARVAHRRDRCVSAFRIRALRPTRSKLSGWPVWVHRVAVAEAPHGEGVH